jgi:LysR family transcriptional regulator, hydrogen peroxide-inducible genes activator
MASPNDLSLRQLQYVVAVADTLGFHKAAARCHVSQPTLSTQVQQIESVLGVPIFERSRHGVLVTGAGQEIVARARRVIIEVDDLLVAAARARDPFAGVLRVGVIPTIAPYFLPEVTPSIAARHPKLRILFREAKTADLVRELREGQLDAGVLALGPEIGDLSHAEIAVDPFVVALPRGHALARKKRVSLADLEGVDVLLLDDTHCFGGQALALCNRAGAHETAFRATSLVTLAQMVSSGAGVTLLPAMAVPVENRRAQLEARPFVPPVPSRTVVLAWRPGSPLARVLEELASHMRSDAKARERAL